MPFTVSGKLRSGIFKLEGNVSSQFVTGLLFALPLLENDSEIVLTSRLESKPYADMTISCLDKFGVKISETGNGYYIKGGQKLQTCKSYCGRRLFSGGIFLCGKYSRKRYKNK